jgi:hypothetical protein
MIMTCEVCGHDNTHHLKKWSKIRVSFPCDQCDCHDFSWPEEGRLSDRR